MAKTEGKLNTDNLESTPYDCAAILEHHFYLSLAGKLFFSYTTYMFSSNMVARLIKAITGFSLPALSFPKSSISFNSIAVPLLAVFFHVFGC